MFFRLQLHLLRISQVSHNAGHTPSKFFPAQYTLALSSPTPTRMNPLRINDPDMNPYATVPKVYPSLRETRFVSSIYVRTHPSSRCLKCTTTMGVLTPKSSQTHRSLPITITKDVPRYAEVARLCVSFLVVLRPNLHIMPGITAQQRVIYLGPNDVCGAFIIRYFWTSPKLMTLCSESADSSTSSLGVQTPSDTLFPDAHFTNGHNNDTTPNSHDTTINDSNPHPAFSSLEVELSMVTEDLPASNNSNSNYSYPNDTPMIPQRASQVFGFLTAKSQTRHQSQNNPKERPRPALPATVQALTSRFSSYSSSAGSHESNISSSDDTHIHEIESTIPSSYNQASPRWPSESNWLEPPPSGMRNQTISTTISYNKLPASPNVQQVVTSAPEAQISRLPRGPRALPQSHSNSTQLNPSEKQVHLDFNSSRQVPRRAFEYTPRSNITTASASNLLASNNIDAFTSIPSRPSHRRTPRSSTALTLASSNHEKSDLRYVAPTAVKPIQPQELKEMSPVHDKENENEGAVLYKAPMTPVRSRSVFRAPNGVTPSPASSSDLSPVAQQLMADLRTQRMHARERQKRNGRWGSTTSKLKW
jgi:hypothetical protein